MLLSTDSLTKTFDGVTAVAGVDFTIDEGELCSVIGPNGAGKTTFFNLLTGVLEPTAGQIAFSPPNGESDGHGRGDGADDPIDITHADPHETALLGLHRSYQITNIFPTVSVRENVRIAVQAHEGSDSWRLWRNVHAFEDHFAQAEAILERVGLDDRADRIAQHLSHGEKRSLEIAIALAGEPDLLLLDEPTAGVSSEDVSQVTDVVEDIADDHAIMLIEHNMDVVMDISDRVVVLNRGEVIADGEPADVRASEAVQRAYLGGYGEGDTAGSEAEEGSESGVATG